MASFQAAADKSRFFPLVNSISYKPEIMRTGLACVLPKTGQNLVHDLSLQFSRSHECGMAAPLVFVQRLHIRHNVCAQGIEMNISDQFEQVGFLLADNGLVPVLENMPGAAMPSIESNGISGEQTAHELFELDASGAEQQVEMIWNERPGKTVGIRFQQQV